MAEEISEQLYERGAELASKNKTLSLLSKLYEISILSLEPRNLAEKICQEIQTNLVFELVGIMLYKGPEETLIPLAFSSSERLSKLQDDSKVFFDKISIPLTHSPLLKKVITDRKMGYTENSFDIWDELIGKGVYAEIINEGHVKSSIIYPLVSGENVIGILIFSLNRPYESLLDYEKESISGFINVVAVAIDKAIISEALEIANREQVALIHFITHQIKGFFTKSKYIFSAILDGDYGPIAEPLKDVVSKGFESDNKGIAMVADILNAANLKKGTVKYEMKEVDLRALIEEVALDQKKAAEDKGLKFDLRLDPAGDYKISGDAEHLRHAFKNLIDNSVHYTQTGSIAVTLSRRGNKILFSVEDTGVGISPADKARLFTEGGRGVNSIHLNTDSTGYGLFIVKQIIEAHNGRVWAESEGEGKGAKFWVEV